MLFVVLLFVLLFVIVVCIVCFLFSCFLFDCTVLALWLVSFIVFRCFRRCISLFLHCYSLHIFICFKTPTAYITIADGWVHGAAQQLFTMTNTPRVNSISYGWVVLSVVLNVVFVVVACCVVCCCLKHTTCQFHFIHIDCFK
jgi:hypothetical protein